ncbi:class I SAM-dependent methyltransferase [Candidatus Fermentibacterales bacterium]|nr:class I SAM-dependent methyltransferase [Candidatus Fermentibacterales bacterium]
MEEIPSLAVVCDIEYGAWRATVLKTALELDIFTVVSGSGPFLDSIALASGCSPKGLEVLLNALCPLGLLKRNENGYELTPVSDAYLVRGKETFYGDWCLTAQLAWPIRARSADAVRTGEALVDDYSDQSKQDDWVADFGPAMMNWPARLEYFTRLWKSVGVLPLPSGEQRILELACGPGLKSMALLRGNPEARVTLNDFPGILRLTRKIAADAGLISQVEPLPGNMEEVDLGESRYDLVICGSMLYYFSGRRLAEMLSRISKSLRQGGALIVQEPIADEWKCESEAALMAAFQLLLFAPGSEVRSFEEYRSALQESGFRQVDLIHEDMIRARKGGMFGGGRQ